MAKTLREIIPLNEANSFRTAKVKADWHGDRARSHEAWALPMTLGPSPYSALGSKLGHPAAPGSKFTDAHKAKRHRQAQTAAFRVMAKRIGDTN